MVPPQTKLKACYANRWNPITALAEANDGSLNVHWDEYSSGFDCSMARDQLIIHKSDLAIAKPADSKPADWGKIRTWVDSTGRHKIQAKLLRRTVDTVTLETADGRSITLPLEKLSDQDRELLKPASGDPAKNLFAP